MSKLDVDSQYESTGSAESFFSCTDDEQYYAPHRKLNDRLLNSKYIELKNSNERLRSCIRTRRELSNIPHHLLENTTNKIINDVFGGNNKLLTFLINECHTKQRKQIYQIIKDTNLEYKRLKKEKPSKIQKNKEEIKTVKQRKYFDIISNESISYILGYLNRSEIYQFKLLSSRLSIICLQEMMKFRLNISNMNDLINDDFKNKAVAINTIKMIGHRFNANRTIQYIQEKCNQIYGINEENQILIPISTHNNVGFKIDNKRIKEIKRESRSYIKISNLEWRKQITMFDKQKIIKINDINDIQIMSSTDELDRNHQLIILKYFDIFDESVDVIQYILIHQNINYQQIMQYIENHFISITKKQKLFHKSFTNNMNKMRFDDGNQDILLMYHQVFVPNDQRYQPYDEWQWQIVDKNDSIYKLFRYNKCKILTFQLNYKHKWIYQQITNTNIKHQNYIKFQNYLDNKRVITVSSKDDIVTLKCKIESFADCTVSPNISDFGQMFSFDHDAKVKQYKFQNGCITFGELKTMIAKDLGNNINPNNIEIGSRARKFFNNDEFVLCPTGSCFGFEIVSYDTSHRNDKHVYEISIFLPDNIPSPFYCREKAIKVRIQYDKIFIVDNMINYIFDNVLERPFYLNQLKAISHLVDKDKNNIEFVLCERNECVANDEYRADPSTTNRVIVFKLFVMLKPMMNKVSKIKIYFLRNIQALNKKSLFSELNGYFFWGFPLEISIKANQSIADIINSNEKLSQYKQYFNVKYAFKVDKNDNIVRTATDYKVINDDLIILRVVKRGDVYSGIECEWFV